MGDMSSSCVQRSRCLVLGQGRFCQPEAPADTCRSERHRVCGLESPVQEYIGGHIHPIGDQRTTNAVDTIKRGVTEAQFAADIGARHPDGTYSAANILEKYTGADFYAVSNQRVTVGVSAFQLSTSTIELTSDFRAGQPDRALRYEPL